VTKPTAPGWYWRRFAPGDKPDVGEVVNEGGTLRVYFPQTPGGNGYDLDDVDGEWVGPIQPPAGWLPVSKGQRPAERPVSL
jgi:hypothetical protein